MLHKSQTLKRWVLSSLLKVLISTAWRTSVGRQFQSWGEGEGRICKSTISEFSEALIENHVWGVQLHDDI